MYGGTSGAAPVMTGAATVNGWPLRSRRSVEATIAAKNAGRVTSRRATAIHCAMRSPAIGGAPAGALRLAMSTAPATMPGQRSGA
jgi:hypothetical protein